MAPTGQQNVVINISGQRFVTSFAMLQGEAESLLAQLIRDHCHSPVRLNEIFLCRDPSVFQYVLNYFREGVRAKLPDVAEVDTLRRLIKEAEFYQLHGLVPTAWRVMKGLSAVPEPLQVDSEVFWNPSTLGLYWQSVAVMSRCYAPRRAHYQVIGFVKSSYQLTRDSTWWCFDVRCPACSSFDFAPMDGYLDFTYMESNIKATMRTARGKVRKICCNTCVLVDWDQGWRFHMPSSALLLIGSI